MIDMREPPIAIGPVVDGSVLLLSPKSEPLVTQGAPGDDRWYLAVYAFGGQGKSRGVPGWHPVRGFKDKADAVALHDMLVKGECTWRDVVHMPIRDGKRQRIITLG